MGTITLEQVKKINKTAIAEKYNCSSEYVSMVLKGEREANTEKAKSILADAEAIIKVLEPKKTA